MYFRNKESHTNAILNPPMDLWTLLAFNDISRYYTKMARDCFLLYALIPALKW